jgi:hypothetical protein
MENEERGRHVRKALFEVLENQMSMDNPPETRKTYQRLLDQGFSREETMRMMAAVVIVEMNDIVKHNRTFDEAGYIEALKALQQLPYDENEDDDEPEDD